MTKRIAILGLLQESNTFQRQQTLLSDFEADVFAVGQEVGQRFAGSQHEIGGFLAGVRQAGWQVEPVFVARALPFGVIDAEAFRKLVDHLVQGLEQAGAVDGVLAAAHGATVAAGHPDADGHWLSEVRRVMGPDTPLIATIDAHANLSQCMVDACDALIGYRTNPHIDQFERGQEAARLLAQTLRGECQPTMAAAFPPFAMCIDAQDTTSEPCRSIGELVEQVRRRPGVLSASLVLGFPYADVAEMGSSVVVVTDHDLPLAQEYANEIADHLWQAREEFTAPRLTVAEAVQRCLAAEPPIGLLDMGDNVGGGSSADGTWLAHELIRQQVRSSVVCLYDPEAVKQAVQQGVGQRLIMEVGARSGPQSGTPISSSFVVRSISVGRFTEAQATHGGFTSFDQGTTAVLEMDDGPTLVVTSRRMAPFSVGQLTSAGLDPAAFRILVLKGVNAPLAAYRSVCRTFVRADTPGETAADLLQLDFTKRRRPMFPFEPRAEWPVTARSGA